MKTLKFLLEKEFKKIKRDKFLPKMIFIMPVMQLLILPFAANFEMKNINLSVVDNDHSVYSQRLVDKVLSSGYFQLTDVSFSHNQAMHSIERNQVDIILEIPLRFEHDLINESQVKLSVSANAVNGTKGGLGASYLSSIIRDFNEELLMEWNHAKTLPPVEVLSINRFNPHLNYKTYMVPGIMFFLLSIVAGFMSSLNIVSEKEKGTIEQMNVTPVPKHVFILSKLIPFWIIGFILLTLSVIIARIVYGIIPLGNLGIIYLFASVYLIAFTGLGLAVSTISSTQQQAMFTTFFFFIIFSLLSGLFTPISSMPEWAQNITLFNPLRYAVEVVRMVYLKGSALSDLLPQFGAVCCFAVVFNVVAVLGYRKSS